MTQNAINILGVRRRLGRVTWGLPREFGPTGWILDTWEVGGARVIISDGPAPDGTGPWRHASISHPDRMPTYEELAALHAAVWPSGWSYQVFAPPAAHVNIHAYALHLWGRPDGAALLPNFGANGTI